MPGIVPIPTPVFHITHVGNLNRIINSGCLECVNLMSGSGATFTNIAHQNIQDRRLSTIVPCNPSGCLHDYVPFYFTILSPMLYTINRGNVSGYNLGQNQIVYLCTIAQKVQNAGIQFVFTDGHGVVVLTDFFNDLNKLSKIDWNIIKGIRWNDNPSNPDRKRKKQAEFLVHNSLPWELIDAIVVQNGTMQGQVNTIIANCSHKPTVSIQPSWYY